MTGAGISRISSSVEFDGLPVRELIPAPVLTLLGDDAGILERLQVVCRTHMWFDPLGKLTVFESRVWIPVWSTEDAFILISGNLRTRDLNEQLHLTVRVMSGTTYEIDIPLHEETPWSEMFTPETQLPGLKIGQSWTVRTYNPFDTAVSGLNPLEGIGLSAASGIPKLRARVTGRKTLLWNGEERSVLEVVQTSADDDLRGTAGRGTLVGKMYVDDEGNVLQEECYWNRHVIRFVRKPLPEKNSDAYDQLMRKVGDCTSELRRNRFLPGERSGVGTSEVDPLTLHRSTPGEPEPDSSDTDPSDTGEPDGNPGRGGEDCNAGKFCQRLTIRGRIAQN